jgi:hypothetical protein
MNPPCFAWLADKSTVATGTGVGSGVGSGVASGVGSAVGGAVGAGLAVRVGRGVLFSVGVGEGPTASPPPQATQSASKQTIKKTGRTNLCYREKHKSGQSYLVLELLTSHHRLL